MPELQVGTRVVAAEYGPGTVTETGEDYVAVAFDDGREALLKRDMHDLRPSSEAAVMANTAEPSTPDMEARPWPESTFVFEAAGTAHYLGSHWFPFVDDSADILKRLPEIAQEWLYHGGFGDTKHPTPGQIPPDWPQGWHFAWPTPRAGLMATLRFEDDANHIVTLYPFYELGSQHTMRLQTVTVWEDGCTAQLTASIGAAQLTFFDTSYLINRVWYQSDWLYDFILTGIAYAARPAEQLEIMVDQHPEVARWLESVQGEKAGEHEGDPQASISLAGMALLLPVDEWDYDDYEFRGSVTSVKEVHDILGQDGWLVKATVLRDVLGSGNQSEDVDLGILITRKAWEGAEAPTVGQDIEGRLWLQGRLWYPHKYGTMRHPVNPSK